QSVRADHAGAVQVGGDLRQAGALSEDHRGRSRAVPGRRARAEEQRQRHRAGDRQRDGDRRQCGDEGREPATRAGVSQPARRRPAAHGAFLKTTEALVPPNPKLLESATSIFIGLALLGARSSAVSTDGLSRLMVGGAIWSRSASTLNAASTAPAAPSRWPIDDLVDDMVTLPAAWPKSRSTAPNSISSPSGVEVP